MADKNKTGGLSPEARAAIAEMEAKRAAYSNNPDPLPIAEPEAAEPSLTLSSEELTEECAGEPETDIGNGRRFVSRFGDRALNVINVGWHGFDGMRWKEDPAGSIVRSWAHRTAEFIDDEAIMLDCSDDERAKIDAGRLARERMRAMGKPPAVNDDAGGERLRHLESLIADAGEAEKERVRLGPAKQDWEDEQHEALAAIKVRIRKGRDAEREKRKLVDATASWSSEDYAEYGRLEKDVAALEEVEENRKGRMSSRHNHAKSSCSTNKLNCMLSEAIPYLSREVSAFNRDYYAINCQTGTLRFICDEIDGKRQWKARLDPHRSGDLISKLAEVELKGEAMAPVFERFFQQVMPNADLRAYIQRYMGYCLLGLTTEQCLLFFYGAGRNGKSTFVDLMVEILGDYAVSMSIDSFAGDKRRSGAEATPDLARLPGARLVAASEPEMGVHLKDALVKSLTGGEVIAVRRLNQDFFELVPQFKIILSGNHKPIIRDDSDGIWRRVKLVPWDVQIPESDVDRDLPRKLRAEKAGIFAWMVRGALDYLQRGLMEPEGISAATREYREENDPLGAFVRGACIVTGSDSDKESPLDLFNAYSRFARREGLSEFKQATFTKRFPDQARKNWQGEDGMMHMFRKGKASATFYYGIRIRDEFREQAGVAPLHRDDEPLPEPF
ncbi:phage/plasmid primase, P4 family [Martelella sp. HB161492]|uniref:phage/plasmid primase, P4 family n=1 Tax=Martelella sp. HB161492 TaxID=2720726 RepID=UPI001592A70E|nr:phage/plasmid primase, P4 family [Martelella sp. HB161492]